MNPGHKRADTCLCRRKLTGAYVEDQTVMNNAGAAISMHDYPKATGYSSARPALCIGLDMAWFGGAKNDPGSQCNYLVASTYDPGQRVERLSCSRVKLESRDQEATQIADAVASLLREAEAAGQRIVLAIDAPLQSNSNEPPAGRQRARRPCEIHFSNCRKKIDRASGGSAGWQPNVQPGVPLAPRVQRLAEILQNKHGFVLWTDANAQADRLVLECFPAEAIWVAKRLSCYPEDLTVAVVKSYKGKAQRGKYLSGDQVRSLVRNVLNGFGSVSGEHSGWPMLTDQIVAYLLNESAWKENGLYRGGKILDDVVDSAICLATAVSYAHGNAHVWYDPDIPDGGHIAGPGTFNDLAYKLQTGGIHLT